MAGDPVPSEGTYSNAVGLLFVFNLIVGTGALALPKSFQLAGYGASILLTHISCLISFICATFVIESMAVANAALLRERRRKGEDDGEEETSSSSSFQITKRTEVSEMARLFLTRWGLIMSYFFLIVYLFGDLAIYSTAVSKSIMNIICDSVESAANVSGPCWRGGNYEIDRSNVYRITSFAFTAFVTPMVLVGITKTKYLQISTSASRWTAFLLMTVLATISLCRHGVQGSPPFMDLNHFGPLFGATVYAFMCHHSLPGLITPMRSKGHIMASVGFVYVLVLVFYVTLGLMGSYTFKHVFDVYTLNFLQDMPSDTVINLIMGYFLALFPVFTISTNYPIIANTLANNLCIVVDMIRNVQLREEQRSLLNEEDDAEPIVPERRAETSQVVLKRCCLVLVLIGPLIISLITDNVLLLAGLTGSYPGVGVQYIIPALLVMYARRYSRREFGIPVPSEVSSPFKSMFWPIAMLVWSGFTTAMVTVNLFK